MPKKIKDLAIEKKFRGMVKQSILNYEMKKGEKIPPLNLYCISRVLKYFMAMNDEMIVSPYSND